MAGAHCGLCDARGYGCGIEEVGKEIMQNRIYWGSNVPKNWKRATPKAQSIPSLPVAFESKQDRGPARTYRFVVSTNTVDRSNDTIDQSGWDLKAYRRNPVVLWSHDASNWPVGKATKIGVEGGKLVAEVMFAGTFEGRKAQALVDAGFLKSTSVGFQPTEFKMSLDRERMGGVDFKKQQLMEFSIVNVPANPDCLICMSAEEVREERKAEAAELLARIAADEAKAVKAKPAPKPVISELEQARARRAERQRIAAMSPDEYAAHLNAKLAKKEARRVELARLKGAQ
jgi:HK97 family phage prohead protease